MLNRIFWWSAKPPWLARDLTGLYICLPNIESDRIRVYARIRPRTLEESKRQEELGVENDQFEVSNPQFELLIIFGVEINCVISTRLEFDTLVKLLFLNIEFPC